MPRRYLVLYLDPPTNKYDPKMSCKCVGWMDTKAKTGVFEVGRRYYMSCQYKLPVDYDPIGRTRAEIQAVAYFEDI